MKTRYLMLFLTVVLVSPVVAATQNGSEQPSRVILEACLSWQRVEGPHVGPTPVLWGVFGTTSNDVWAVGAYYSPVAHVHLQHWDGARWSPIPDATTDLPVSLVRAGAAISPNDAWVVGFYALQDDGLGRLQPLFEHWDGHQWSVVQSPQVGGSTLLLGVTAIASDDVWAVGRYSVGRDDVHPLVEHWDGTAWTIMPTAAVDANHALNAITAISARDIWAVGWQVTATRQTPRGGVVMERGPLIEHWDGTAWTVVPSPPSSAEGFVGLNAVAATSPDDVWAVAEMAIDDGGWVRHWDGSTWTVVPFDLDARTLTGVAALAGDDVWVVGTGTMDLLAAHWDGRQWTRSDLNAGGVRLLGVVGWPNDDVWTVGETGTDTLTLLYRDRCGDAASALR
jgi:hypothetical protein